MKLTAIWSARNNDFDVAFRKTRPDGIGIMALQNTLLRLMQIASAQPFVLHQPIRPCRLAKSPRSSSDLIRKAG